MKKRLLSLFLTLFLTCALVSCGDYGEFYTEDGILQNTQVTLTVETENLVAPVTELSYTLFEQSDFGVVNEKYEDGILLEKRENGEWKRVPSFGEIITKTLENREPGDFHLHQTRKGSLRFWTAAEIQDQDEAKSNLHYLALEAGEYRLRVGYTLYTDDEDIEIPEGQLEAVAYFTVTAE